MEDFATSENITPEYRIITSDRYQFDIRSIVKWINEKGSYNNPYTGAAFKPEDQKSIHDTALAKGLTINVGHVYHVEEHPAMLAAAIELAMAPDPHPPVVVAPPAPPPGTGVSLPQLMTGGVGFFVPPPALPTVEQLQSLLSPVLVHRAANNIATATLIFNTPNLRAALLAGSPGSVRACLTGIACGGVAQATLIFDTPDLRARLLFAPPDSGNPSTNLIAIARSGIDQAHLVFDAPDLRAALLNDDDHRVSWGLTHIAAHSIDQAFLIFNDQELREHLLGDTPQYTSAHLDYIANRYLESEAIQTLCAQYMPVLPHQQPAP